MTQSISLTKVQTHLGEILRERVTILILGFFLIIALIVFALIPIFAAQWMQTPFIGGFVENTMVFNLTGPDSWAVNQKIHALQSGEASTFGYQLLTVNGQSVANSQSLSHLLQKMQPGETVSLGLNTPDGTVVQFSVKLTDFQSAWRLQYFYVPYFLGLIYLLAGLWMFSLRRHDRAGRAFAIFSTAAALSIASLFDLYTTHRLTTLWTISLAMTGGGIFNLSLVFPKPGKTIQKYPYLPWIGYLIAFGLALNTLPTLFNLQSPTAYAAAWRWIFIYTGATILIFLLWTAYRRFTTQSPILREQMRIILWGTVAAFLPVFIWFLLALLSPGKYPFSSIILLTLIAFPAAVSYAIIRYRLLNTDYILSRTVVYATLTVLAIGMYAALVSALSLLLGQTIPANHPISVGIFVVLIAFGLNPLKNRLQRQIDQIFFRGQAAYRERLQNFSQQLVQKTDLQSILHTLKAHIEESLAPSQTHIFMLDALSGQYQSTTGLDGTHTSDIRFPTNSALAITLQKKKASIFTGEGDIISESVPADRARLALLATQLYIPLPSQQQLVGWVALGARKSGEPYTKDDLIFLESMGAQAAVALERAQVVENLERRAYEMNVLSRLAQGVNITLQFDDMLELIYAQTNHILPTHDFFISLYDSESDFLSHAFYLENNERLPSKENIPLRRGYGLEHEALKEGRAILSDDYEQTCRQRGVVPTIQGVYGWLSAPLNAGAETIGVISIASRDSGIFYTLEQRNLLQAIADQAAGAIVKARLLQETEQRARQLATLNEVATSMTATLEVDPLLEQILGSAVDILGCEAGSLLLVDEQTDELVFKVTVGPVANDLSGQRLPPNTGLVGKAVQTGQCVIVNDVQTTKDWFEQADKNTGFATNALLAAPMKIRSRVIGVIEVINKLNRRPFTHDDETLLLSFAGQAAIAIENARLFTLTDQALADRVDELSIMQRIDQELNASLDVQRALEITLRWAMRQSESHAGLIALVKQTGLRMMASQGYTVNPWQEDSQDYFNPQDLPIFTETLKAGHPQSMVREAGWSSPGFEASTQSTVCIPIQREEKSIGLILLERTQAESANPETIAFLSRLSDHAAIAIANAQLYAEVQQANIAKSDFVSFAAHELKTPMTSIRGYTDLLLSGNVGTVSEAQINFLRTVRSNVDRMATLVTDLADVSRIEAGRLRLEFSRLPMQEVIDEVIRSTQHLIENKKQTLVLDVPKDLTPVWGDRGRLIQILTNLVSNAYKYTPQGGTITIHAEHTQNQWDVNGAPEVVHLSVQDTGIGISEEDQKSIFQKFFRSEDEKTRQAPGTGLGLNITKNLVELQGGKIWFESVFRQGTTFHFTVPIAETN